MEKGRFRAKRNSSGSLDETQNCLHVQKPTTSASRCSASLSYDFIKGRPRVALRIRMRCSLYRARATERLTERCGFERGFRLSCSDKKRRSARAGCMLYGGWDQLQTPMSKSHDVDQAHGRVFEPRTVDRACRRRARRHARTYDVPRCPSLGASGPRRLATRSQPIGRDTQSNPRKQPLARLTVDSSLSR